MVFYIAAAYGYDPRHPMRPAELLALWGVYDTPAEARASWTESARGWLRRSWRTGWPASSDRHVSKLLLRYVGKRAIKASRRPARAVSRRADQRGAERRIHEGSRPPGAAVLRRRGRPARALRFAFPRQAALASGGTGRIYALIKRTGEVHMAKRLTILLVALLALGFVVAGCGDDDDDKRKRQPPPSRRRRRRATEDSGGGSAASGVADSPQAKQAIENCKAAGGHELAALRRGQEEGRRGLRGSRQR